MTTSILIKISCAIGWVGLTIYALLHPEEDFRVGYISNSITLAIIMALMACAEHMKNKEKDDAHV